MHLARPYALILLALAACKVQDERKLAADSAAAARKATTIANAPKPAGAASGFHEPESARYDSALDVFFVSNINGAPEAKDGNGFISRVRPDGTVDSLMFIAGGRGGVTLNAPKGLVITGDTLWVADIDAVRAFDKRTGAPLATIDFRPLGAAFLNDIAAAPDGSLYITDTGPNSVSDKTRGNRIFRIGPGHRASVALHSDSLASPNGITWDERGKRFIVVQWGGRRIIAWRPGEAQPHTIGFGALQSDGVEVLPDGRLIFTSWAEHAIIIHYGAEEFTVRGFSAPADFGVDTRRRRLAIPVMDKDRVEFWDIPPLSP
jgi:sugar lactone lactonase YvrE